MEIIQIGSMPVSIQTLSIFLSLGTAFIGLLLICHYLIDGNYKPAYEWLFSGVFNSIWVWKFSPIIFQPIESFKHPLTLLYFTGGTKGIVLACVFFIGYSIWKIYKQPQFIHSFLLQTVLLWMIGSGVFLVWKNTFGSANDGAEVFLLLMLVTVSWYLLTGKNILLIGTFYALTSGVFAFFYDYNAAFYFLSGSFIFVLYLLPLSNLNKRGAQYSQEVMKWRM
ncbi:hypothetical protein [Fictibacillus sp. BK138]|uniref:hypothetical protein n=1 Tax=Fictibacillus sp. BK138 TaxID=2512121 RepID=UPI00102A27AE|nr:hypothetical protein [Fictibacillus sp. BK138]RZT24268.1 hypothetical protein EV282_3372 [Fictibacillus sp. BK138]